MPIRPNNANNIQSPCSYLHVLVAVPSLYQPSLVTIDFHQDASIRVDAIVSTADVGDGSAGIGVEAQQVLCAYRFAVKVSYDSPKRAHGFNIPENC